MENKSLEEKSLSLGIELVQHDPTEYEIAYYTFMELIVRHINEIIDLLQIKQKDFSVLAGFSRTHISETRRTVDEEIEKILASHSAGSEAARQKCKEVLNTMVKRSYFQSLLVAIDTICLNDSSASIALMKWLQDKWTDSCFNSDFPLDYMEDLSLLQPWLITKTGLTARYCRLAFNKDYYDSTLEKLRRTIGTVDKIYFTVPSVDRIIDYWRNDAAEKPVLPCELTAGLIGEILDQDFTTNDIYISRSMIKALYNGHSKGDIQWLGRYQNIRLYHQDDTAMQTDILNLMLQVYPDRSEYDTKLLIFCSNAEEVFHTRQYVRILQDKGNPIPDHVVYAYLGQDEDESAMIFETENTVFSQTYRVERT